MALLVHHLVSSSVPLCLVFSSKPNNVPRCRKHLPFSNSAAMLSRHACGSSSSRKLVTQRVAFVLARRQPRRPVSQQSLTHDHLTSPHFNADLASRDRSGFSDLGLRSSKPPDSIPDSDPKSPSEILDQDWELRTGSVFSVQKQFLQSYSGNYRTRHLRTTTNIARFLRYGAHHLPRQKDGGTGTPIHQHPDRQRQSP